MIDGGMVLRAFGEALRLVLVYLGSVVAVLEVGRRPGIPVWLRRTIVFGALTMMLADVFLRVQVYERHQQEKQRSNDAELRQFLEKHRAPFHLMPT